MTESSKDKTKRNLINAMMKYNPIHSTSLFFNDYSEREEALTVFKDIRTPLSRTESETTFIFYLRTCGGLTSRTKNPPDKYKAFKIWIPQIQIFTTSIIDKEIVENVLHRIGYGHLDINIDQRKANMVNSSWIEKVKKQEPQNLRDYFNLHRSPRRFNITNKQATKVVIQDQEEHGAIF